jgi:hypothetical protein
MKLGFALSPGGLLLPYHLGALECLEYEHVLLPGSSESPVAGSSAGSIAAMAHGCGLSKRRVLEATIDVSDQSAALGGARGRLLPLLQNQMNQLVGEEEFDYLVQNSQQNQHDADTIPTTNIGIAYTEVFPQRRSILQTSFETRHDLFQAVSASCMFPFFATNFPCLWDRSRGGGSLWKSRLLMDGFFSVPRDRFGCPDFEVATYGEGGGISSKTSTSSTTFEEESSRTSTTTPNPMEVDRTIAISVFPRSSIGLTAFDEEDTISPSSSTDDIISLEDLFRIATQATSRQELTGIYELGYQNAEAWCRNEQTRDLRKEQREREDARKLL